MNIQYHFPVILYMSKHINITQPLIEKYFAYCAVWNIVYTTRHFGGVRDKHRGVSLMLCIGVASEVRKIRK